MVNDRIKLLKEMNQYILNLGDEDIFDIWFSVGIPDEATEEDYRVIAEDTKEWVYICKMFGKLIAQGEGE